MVTKKSLITGVLIAALICSISSGCLEKTYPVKDKGLPQWTEINKRYEVKEIHTAIMKGSQFTEVYYYNPDGSIQMVDDNILIDSSLATVSHGNQLTFYRTNESTPYMIHVKQYNYVGYTFDGVYCPDNIFNVYVPDNVSFNGQKTTWEETHSNGKTHYTTEESAEIM